MQRKSSDWLLFREVRRLAARLLQSGGVRLTPEGRLACSRDLFNTPPSLVTVGGGSFAVDDLAPSRDARTLGGSLDAAMSDRLALFAAYHATGNLLAQTVEAGLTYKF